eukprot:COSAG05_NODE_729_length_7683_cov_4.662843_4_plen_94_part_00
MHGSKWPINSARIVWARSGKRTLTDGEVRRSAVRHRELFASRCRLGERDTESQPVTHVRMMMTVLPNMIMMMMMMIMVMMVMMMMMMMMMMTI